jgi:sulfur carrier protein ThiS
MGIDSMKISVTILPENSKKTIEVLKGTLIIDMLRTMKLLPDSLIVMRNNHPIPVDEELIKDEHLSILKVASGG